MFQTFDDVNDPGVGARRLPQLRAEVARRGLDGFLVPLADEYQGEYIPASARRLAWLTGFTGSAGLAMVLAKTAALFVDGRYTLQARVQSDTTLFEQHHLVDEPPHLWLARAVTAGQRIGFDPWLMTDAEVVRYRAALARVGAELVATDGNPIDAVWSDRPEPPTGAVTVRSDEISGQSPAAKIARIRADIAATGADRAVITRPDSIAWLFNIRGADLPHTPEPLSFAILPLDGKPTLFIDGRKLDGIARAHLEGVTALAAPDAFAPALAGLGGAVLLDRSTAAYAVVEALAAGGARIVDGPDPIVLPKAMKNAAELAGSRAAHVRDGAAMVRFLTWFDREAAAGTLDEIAAAKALEEFRRHTNLVKDLSFDTIAGAGPHAALPHYRVNVESNRRIGIGEIFLVDSGAQYEAGTTDITRTVIVGTPTPEMADRFTRVLKGHIALARARFPKGTTGAHLDVLARQFLWEAGLDFDHGTGHGVGVYLSVHEGPARISRANHVPLEPGMILSNEPGYYKTDAYGIRIENLMVVTDAVDVAGGERPMMGFEILSFCPIDRRLIDTALLSPDERDWIDGYHKEVRTKLLPLVPEGEASAWLVAATEPLSA